MNPHNNTLNSKWLRMAAFHLIGQHILRTLCSECMSSCKLLCALCLCMIVSLYYIIFSLKKMKVSFFVLLLAIASASKWAVLFAGSYGNLHSSH